MRYVRLIVVFLFVLPILAEGGSLPDVRTGNVNGKVGLLYWPANLAAGNAEPQPLPSADNCHVHMVPHDDRDRELRYPCGKWFAPPVGRYNYWLEMPARITPVQNINVYAGSPFRGAGLGAIIPVAPAGAISLANGRALALNEGLRIIATSVKHAPAGNHWVFDRRVSAADANKPVQMPEGAALVGRFDVKTGDAIALTRPIDVRPAQTVMVWPQPPVTSDVLVILNKPPEMQGGDEPVPTAMTLDDGGHKRVADVLVNSANVIVAVWYGIDARRATVSLQSNNAFWQSQEVRLARGKVTTLRSQVQPLPKASVSINVPPDAKLPESLALEIARDREPVRNVPVTAGMHDIADLPAEVLTFTLHVGDWKQAKVVDLTAGEDANVVFDLEPLTIRGTVFHGDAPASARIAFHNGDDTPVVETNERGEYETRLWWPDVYTARVTLLDRDAPPFLDAFREIFTSGRVDFHVPRTDYRVRVVDATTNAPVSGARVIAGSVAAEGGRQSAQHVVTGEDGIAVLPPLRNGELIVDVQHDRYARIEPLRFVVDGDTHEINVPLRPLSLTETLHLVLPDGAPAAEAEAWALDDAMNALWRGASATDGTLSVPDLANGALLLVRHPKAATSVRRWSTGRETTWNLNAPAEPLTIHAEAGAQVVLWLDGVRLSGAPLTIATWSVPMTNRAGMWTGRNLPARPLRILTLAGDDAMTSAAHDAVAREVPYPWPK